MARLTLGTDSVGHSLSQGLNGLYHQEATEVLGLGIARVELTQQLSPRLTS